MAGTSVTAVALADAAYATGGWSVPASIAPSIGGLYGVSCPTAVFCVAAGGSTDGSVLTYNGTSWSAPNNIDPGSGGLDWVSCPTTSFCVAVDSNGYALNYNSGTWSAPVALNPGVALNSVSCTSASFCAADDANGNVYTYNGTWSGGTLLDTNGLNAVSCPMVSGAFVCMVVASTDGNEYTYSGTSWSGPTNADGANSIYGLSCPSSSFCVASDWSGRVVTYNGTGWSASTSVDPAAAPLNVVSCPLPTFCATVGNSGNGFLYNGTQWSGPPAVDPPQNLQGGFMSSVSCPMTSFCAAVDSFGNVLIYKSTTLQITTGNTLPLGTVGATYSTTLAATGGNSPYTWKVARGSAKLPKGLKLNKHTGVISGTPKKTDSGTYTVTVQILDRKIKVKHQPTTQNTDTRVFSITIS